ncbi:hypothetical protein [Cryptosporangium aurantiacum]|nr:hypothetical protein [Cryptosporangium aurantiacum]
MLASSPCGVSSARPSSAVAGPNELIRPVSASIASETTGGAGGSTR